MEKNLEAYKGTKKKFIIGAICFVFGIGCAVALYFFARQIDFVNFNYEKVGDALFFTCLALLLGGYALLGVPFIMLNVIKVIFKRLIAVITHQSDLVSNVAKDDADYYVTKQHKYEYKDHYYVRNEYKGKVQLILETVLGIIGLVVGGIVLYTVGVACSFFVLIGQIIYLSVNAKKVK